MKRLRRKAGLFGLPYRLFEMLFPFIFLHGTACMKQRFFGAQGAEGFSLPAPLTSFLDRERKRFLAFARNDECWEAAFSYRKPSSCVAREAAFSLLPMEGGAPKGRRLASQRTEKSCGGSIVSYRHPERSRGIFFVCRVLFPAWNCLHETPFLGGAGSTVFPACRSSHILFLAANEKDVSLSLEMTNAGKWYSRIVSHLHEESVRRHSPSFPWKEVPRRGGGWHRAG